MSREREGQSRWVACERETASTLCNALPQRPTLAWGPTIAPQSSATSGGVEQTVQTQEQERGKQLGNNAHERLI